MEWESTFFLNGKTLPFYIRNSAEKGSFCCLRYSDTHIFFFSFFFSFSLYSNMSDIESLPLLRQDTRRKKYNRCISVVIFFLLGSTIILVSLLYKSNVLPHHLFIVTLIFFS